MPPPPPSDAPMSELEEIQMKANQTTDEVWIECFTLQKKPFKESWNYMRLEISKANLQLSSVRQNFFRESCS